MTVSVIIPTYNGAHKILGILKAISQQSLPPLEVIVVIDGSTDDTEEVLKEQVFVTENLQVIKRPNGGRAAVRNTGAKAAKGELLVFFDDDMYPTFNCLKVHYEHHLHHQPSILTGSAIDNVQQGGTDFQCFRSSLSQKWSEPLKENNGQPMEEKNVFLMAANFSILKKTFEALAGFDERLTDAEDFDLAVRAFKAGIELFYNHDAFAWHNDLITGKNYIKRLRQYHASHLKLVEVKPTLYKDNNKFLSPQPIGMKKFLFSFFARPFWVRLLDHNRILWALPKKIRYKLYDIIVTANGVYYPEKVSL